MPILLDISQDGKGRINTGAGADDFGFPRYAQNLTRDKTAIYPHNARKKYIRRILISANLANQKQQPIKKRQKFISMKAYDFFE
ncbi:hypothetical protein [Neisseria benedictiae]|uniref:hypothetical protein n=1 Tax=Neisseria benedictiae TaxID=2830649 RepID=UPI00265A51A4|nr:hypothetical protein [Neisseria benedictiae]